MQQFRLLIFACILFFLACNGKNDVPLDTIDLQLDFERVDIDLREAANLLYSDTVVTDLFAYQQFLSPHKEFLVEWFFPGISSDSVPDSILAAIVIGDFARHKAVRELLDTVALNFPHDYDFDKIFLDPFKRFHFYFPEKDIPKIRTWVSGYSTSGQQSTDEISITPHYLGLGLHYFMGKDFPFYPQDLPQYIRRRFVPENIASLVFKETANRIVPEPPPMTQARLLDKIILSGMRLYFLDMILPETDDSLKIQYTREQLHWAYFYEDRIWAEILPDLYSTDLGVQGRYLSEAPFTTGLIRESAPRIGEFCGWMIVHNYMANNPELDLPSLLAETDMEKILKGAKYRPGSK